MLRLLFIMTLVFLNTTVALADCANPPSGSKLLEQADAIFIGKVKNSSPYWMSYIMPQKYNFYTSFEVLEKLKGEVGNQTKVYYRYSRNSRPTVSPKPYEAGNDFVIFVQKNSDTGQYFFAPCFNNRISMDLVRKQQMNIQAFSSLAALAKAYPSMEEKSIFDAVSKISSEFERSAVIRYLRETHGYPATITPKMQKILDEYDNDPKGYVCTHYGSLSKYSGEGALRNCD